MRIGLFTDTYYPELNGVANSVFQLKKELENRGNDVYVFTVSNPAIKQAEEKVYRLKSIPCSLLKERRMSCTFFHEWFRIIRELKLDIIHTHTEFMVGHIGRKAAEKLHIPHIHTYHTIYEDYTHYLKIPGNEKLKGVIRGLSCICCNHAVDFVELAKRLPQYQFIWFGEANLNTISFKARKAARTKLPNLKFAGYVKPEELREAYGSCDLFLFPSREETEGIVVLEALAMKIPVLIRDIPVYKDWLIANKNVYKADNIDDFEAKAVGILEGKLENLTNEGRLVAEARSVGIIGKKLGRIYESCMDKKQYK